jgi:hypothetical protein
MNDKEEAVFEEWWETVKDDIPDDIPGMVLKSIAKTAFLKGYSTGLDWAADNIT